MVKTISLVAAAVFLFTATAASAGNYRHYGHHYRHGDDHTHTAAIGSKAHSLYPVRRQRLCDRPVSYAGMSSNAWSGRSAIVVGL